MRASIRQTAIVGIAAAAAVAVLDQRGAVDLVEQGEARSGDRVAATTAATRAPRTRPLTDAQAARLVVRSKWEPRPGNARQNMRRPSKRKLRGFRRYSKMPYKRHVTGRFRGTTDEILQWAAHKWGFHPDLLRAVAVAESWWRQRAVGDNGRSFGLMQIKRGHHCCHPLSARSTAFNVDYYAAYLRSVYDGRHRWLNHHQRGGRYKRGDLWRSVGVWYSGRWRYNNSAYTARIKAIVQKRVWRRSGFRAGG